MNPKTFIIPASISVRHSVGQGRAYVVLEFEHDGQISRFACTPAEANRVAEGLQFSAVVAD